MGSRPRFSLLLFVGALALVIAIVIGNRLGSGVMRGVAERVPEDAVTTVPQAQPSDDGGGGPLRLKRRAVLSVATDPAFPDPRITPEPTPKPTPKPTRPPAPEPSPSDDLFPDAGSPPPLDTSPPTLGPGESPSPVASPGP